MGVLNRVADLAQKGTVVGLMSLLGYQVYQIGQNVASESTPTKYHKMDTMGKIKEKVAEDAMHKNSIDRIPDRYDPDDNSYLKRVPNLQEPVKRL